MAKRIRLSGHAREQLDYRGGSEEEVIEAITTATWNEKWYLNKEVRPIFVDEEEEIVVVTVYVYYH